MSARAFGGFSDTSIGVTFPNTISAELNGSNIKTEKINYKIMTKEEYENYIEELQERGYKLVDNRYGNRLYYYKVIEYRKDKYGDNRAVCQLLFYLYATQGLSPNEFFYSIEPHVDVSRNIDERLTFNICHPKRSIDECERIAIEFMEWVDMNIKVPQEDEN